MEEAKLVSEERLALSAKIQSIPWCAGLVTNRETLPIVELADICSASAALIGMRSVTKWASEAVSKTLPAYSASSPSRELLEARLDYDLDTEEEVIEAVNYALNDVIEFRPRLLGEKELDVVRAVSYYISALHNRNTDWWDVSIAVTVTSASSVGMRNRKDRKRVWKNLAGEVDNLRKVILDPRI